MSVSFGGMCLAAEIVLCLITWYCTRPCWGYTVILDFQTIITLLTSKIELNFETHLGLGILENGLWICTYPDVMPEIQRSFFTLFLNLHNIRSLSLLNVSIFFLSFFHKFLFYFCYSSSRSHQFLTGVPQLPAA